MLTAIIYDYEYTRDIVDDDGMHQVGERRGGGAEGEKKFQKARVLRVIKRHHIREKGVARGAGEVVENEVCHYVVRIYTVRVKFALFIPGTEASHT